MGNRYFHIISIVSLVDLFIETQLQFQFLKYNQTIKSINEESMPLGTILFCVCVFFFVSAISKHYLLYLKYAIWHQRSKYGNLVPD